MTSDQLKNHLVDLYLDSVSHLEILQILEKLETDTQKAKQALREAREIVYGPADYVKGGN